jgi:20S proteasome alpha/beta subunit
MTLIAGFRCSDGVLICADREETTTSSKRSIGKIKAILHEKAQIVIAGAGRSSILENAFERFRARYEEIGNDPDLSAKHPSEIQSVLKSIYKDFIWGYPDEAEREVGFIIAARFHNGDLHLHSTDGDIPYPHLAYSCLGVGSDLAFYFADRLYQTSLNRAEMAMLATFIFREVGASVRDVHGAEMIMLFGNGRLRLVEPHIIKEIEAALPEFGDALSKFWKDKARIPTWLKIEPEY